MIQQLPSRLKIFLRPARALILSLGTASALLSLQAQAQNPQVAAPAPSTSEVKTEPTPPVEPRYSAANIERAFNFMDSNKDGQLSREEAARFPKVTKYFDRADTDGDGFLSRDEFDKAMNYVKPE